MCYLIFYYIIDIVQQNIPYIHSSQEFETGIRG